jgi:hypothetical protein
MEFLENNRSIMSKWNWVVLFIAAFSCNPSIPISLEFEMKEFQQKACKGLNCSEVNIKFPVFTQEIESSSILNNLIEEKIIKLIEVNEEIKSSNIEEAATNFLDSYIEFMDLFESNQEWEIKVAARVIFQNSQLMSIEFETYSFTGGAHPNNNRQYLNFDKIENQLLDNESLVLDKSDLLHLVESKFREIHEIEEGVSLKETNMFFLEKDSIFFLPAAIGFEMDSVVFYYNPYEIGPYVIGGTEIKFPKEELKGVLNFYR